MKKELLSLRETLNQNFVTVNNIHTLYSVLRLLAKYRNYLYYNIIFSKKWLNACKLISVTVRYSIQVFTVTRLRNIDTIDYIITIKSKLCSVLLYTSVFILFIMFFHMLM